MQEADRIKAAVGKVRRRQFLILWFNASIIALLALIFWILLCVSGFFHLSGTSPAIHFAIAGFLLCAACAFAVRNMPSWKESVQQIDAILGLEQRLQTAWENMPPRDAMDSLLVADAAAKTEQLQPASMMPMRLHRRTIWCGSFLLSAMASLGMIRVCLDWQQNNSPSSETPAVQARTGMQPARKGPAPAQNKIGSDKLNKPIAAAADNSPEERRTANKEALRRQPEISGQPGLQGTAKPSANALPDKGAAAIKTNPANPTDLTSAGAAAGKKEIPQAVASMTGKPDAKTDDGSASARRPISLSHTAGAQARHNGRDGGMPTGARRNPDANTAGHAAAAGRGNSPRGSKDVAFHQKYVENYPSARTVMEQAISKDTMPPGMKKYIMDYFNAIHP